MATIAAVDSPRSPFQRQAGDIALILVAEDDDAVREFIARALRRDGHEVETVTDGSEALNALQTKRFDMLFTDIVMPGINGRILADRAREARPGLKVLYTTGYTRNAIVHNGMLDPGVSFLAKPFTLDQLAVKVRQVLDGEV